MLTQKESMLEITPTNTLSSVRVQVEQKPLNPGGDLNVSPSIDSPTDNDDRLY